MFKFMTRDCNGNWIERDFESRDKAYQFCLKMAEEYTLVEEIMFITFDGVCIYSSLMADVDWETLVGWFA